MRIKILPTILVLFFIIIFLIFFKSLKNSNVYLPNIDIKKKIPSFTAKIFNSNNKISSDKIFNDNKFYLLNIWSSWCIPCRAEHKFLINLNDEKNLEIIGLNYKDSFDNANSFLNELSNPYKVILLDQNGTLAIEWGAYGVPESFLIYNKNVIKKIIGPINKDSLLEIKRLVK